MLPPLTETVAANSAQPPAIVSPGKSLDDAEGAWPRTVVKYKGKLIQNGTLLTGFLSAVGRAAAFLSRFWGVV